MAELSEEAELLIDGARYGDMEDVTAALEGKASINASDGQGRTGLHMACANGHADIVRLLISSGADVTQANAEGNTPLHWACLNGHTEVVQLLMDSGASPSALNSYERTPIDEALNLVSRDEIMTIIDAHMQPGSSQAISGDEFEDDGGPTTNEDGFKIMTKPQ